MTFWSSQTLESQLEQLVPSGHEPLVDCNSITLTVGNNCYVTPRWSADDSVTQTVRVLAEGETVTIPPGQFGFLETTETVALPKTVMGFISFKATYKMQGLVNVSGFHVDPGWNGPLRFALFNAGPNPIHLKQGMQLFLLWIANLDEPTDKCRNKPSLPDDFIRMVNGVSGSVNSGYDLSDRVAALEMDQARTKEQIGMMKGVGLTLVVGVALMLLRFILVGVFPEGSHLAPEKQDQSVELDRPSQPPASTPLTPPVSGPE